MQPTNARPMASTERVETEGGVTKDTVLLGINEDSKHIQGVIDKIKEVMKGHEGEQKFRVAIQLPRFNAKRFEKDGKIPNVFLRIKSAVEASGGEVVPIESDAAREAMQQAHEEGKCLKYSYASYHLENKGLIAGLEKTARPIQLIVVGAGHFPAIKNHFKINNGRSRRLNYGLGKRFRYRVTQTKSKLLRAYRKAKKAIRRK